MIYLEFDIIKEEGDNMVKHKQDIYITTVKNKKYVVMENDSGYAAIELRPDSRRKSGVRPVEDFQPNLELHQAIVG